MLISSLFACLWLTYSCCCMIGIAICSLRSPKSIHSPCQQRCRRCPHWSRRQLQHFSYCRRSFHSTTRLPEGHSCTSPLAFESLQHVAWPSPVSCLSMASPHKLLHNLPTILLSPILWPLSESADKVPNRDTTVRFKRAALRLLDGLARDVPQPVGKRATSRLPP